MNPAVVLLIMTSLFLIFGYMGVPVAFSLTAGVVIGASFTDVTFAALVQKMFDGVDSEALLAIPFFLLVGELMSSANVVQRVISLSLSLVGHMKGGLSQVVAVFSMFFSEMSGSTTADVAVMSRTLGVSMRREGYDPPFIAAIIASASTIAALVPPSITAVVYGAVGNVSIAGLFMAGFVPGFMIGIGLMIFCYFFGPAGIRRKRASFGQVTDAAKASALPLMIPVILLGGILTGWFTPTEAGVVAVCWILFVVIPLLNPKHVAKLPRDFCFAGLIYSLPLITIAAATAFGWMLAYLRGAIVISDAITSIAGSDPHLIMLMLVLLFTDAGAALHHRRRLHRAGADHHHLHAPGELAHRGRQHQPGPYGRGADRDAGLRTDHAALWAGAADGFEIRRCALFEGAEGGVADLRRVPGHDRLHDLRAQRGALDSQARDAAVSGLLQESQRRGLHLPELIASMIPAAAARSAERPTAACRVSPGRAPDRAGHGGDAPAPGSPTVRTGGQPVWPGASGRAPDQIPRPSTATPRLCSTQVLITSESIALRTRRGVRPAF